MLLGKHFRRGHDACLIPVPYSYKCSKYCHHSLSASHISLQQTVHLVSAFHVIADFGNHAFLCSGKRKRQGFIASVECFTDLRHLYPVFVAAVYVFLFQERKLKEKQLFEFKPVSCTLQRLLVFREMYVFQGEGKRDQSLLLQEPYGQRFLYIRQAGVQGMFLHPAHRLACDASVLQPFGARIDSCHCQSVSLLCASGTRILIVGSVVHLGMHYVHQTVENRRFAEENELLAGFELSVHPFDTFEKDHLQPSCRIFDHHSHPPDQVEFDVMSGACCRPGTATGNILVLTVDIVGCDNPSGPVQFPGQHFGFYLDIGHVRPYLPYGDNAASVDISERV